MARIAALTLVLIFLAARAEAIVITLDFTSLPSAQGWAYFQSGLPENSVFSVNGSALQQSTVGTGFGNGNPNYILSGVVNAIDPFDLIVRTRLLATEGGPSGFGFGVRTAIPNQEYHIGFTNVNVGDPLGNVAAVDTTAFHTYRLSATPGSTYRLFVDGLLALSGPFSATGGALNGVQFGDLNDLTGNANVEITFLQFLQPVTSAPEPGTLLMLTIGVSFFALRRRTSVRRCTRVNNWKAGVAKEGS